MTGPHILGVSTVPACRRRLRSRADGWFAFMPFPLRNLPVMQNWDCQSCGDCCRQFEGVITEEEKLRIESLDLADDPEVGPRPWFAPAGRGSKDWRLRH